MGSGIELVDFEIRVLRSMRGDEDKELYDMAWGAAMSEAIGRLTNLGLIARRNHGMSIRYEINDRGLKKLEELGHVESDDSPREV